VSTDNKNTIGQFELVNCIASGNTTQVWEVVDTETTRRLAMKLLLPEKLKDVEALASLKNEFKAASTFDHPNIPHYHLLVANRENAYFVMDLFAAPNLKTQLYNDIRSVHIRLKHALELIALALEHIHECGWVHRDVKPDNILMNKSAETRLIDFSLACRAAGSLSKMLHRKQTLVQGTRTYMAPEQILGKPLTPQTDVYNFGITIFELLTGEPPFKGSTPKDLLLRHLGEAAPAPSSFNQNVTPEMDLIVQRMLSKKPEQRQKSMTEFMSALRNTRLFKEEVTEKVELSEKQKAEQELQAVLGERLDSRSDALRSKFGVSAPVPVKKKKPPTVSPAGGHGSQVPGGRQGGRPAAPGGVPSMPMQPPMPMQPMPGMYPGQMPMAPYPGMMTPQGPVPWVMSGGQPPGGMPAGPWMQPPPSMPMQPMPMQPMPAHPMPAQPMPAQPMPGQPMPGQPMPMQSIPGQPFGVSPSVPRPPVVPAAAPARPLPVPVTPPSVVPVAPVQPPSRSAPPVSKPAAAQGKSPPAPPRPAVPRKSGEGFNIEDLAGFDDLKPES